MVQISESHLGAQEKMLISAQFFGFFNRSHGTIQEDNFVKLLKEVSEFYSTGI